MWLRADPDLLRCDDQAETVSTLSLISFPASLVSRVEQRCMHRRRARCHCREKV